jgi:tRNA pseudouridine38-40 synthase
MATFKLTLEYDGTAYAGWQRQADQPTVQAALEAAIQQITQTRVPVIGAGRTDAGVHALGQVASFRSEKPFSCNEWERALNGLLPDDISVLSVETVSDDFHARYSAKQKLYTYRILNRRERSALDRVRAWHIRTPLDLPSMQQAALLLTGRHDFTSFEGSPTDNENPLCDLRRLEIQPVPEGSLTIDVLADRFLKQMVRAIVGTLVEVGQGKRPAASVKDILEARDRRLAGYTAPAHGLYLVRVDY